MDLGLFMSSLLLGISKKDMTLLALLFLALALPLTVLLVKQRLDIRPRAIVSGGPAILYLSAPGVTTSNNTVNPGQAFSVDLYVNHPAGRPVSTVEAYLSYPSNLLDVVSTSIDTTNFPVILKNTSGNGNIDLSAGIAP